MRFAVVAVTHACCKPAIVPRPPRGFGTRPDCRDHASVDLDAKLA